VAAGCRAGEDRIVRRPGGRNGQGQLGKGTDLGAFVELGERVAARRSHPILVGERRQEVGQERERGGRLGGPGGGGAARSTHVGTLLDPVVVRKNRDDDADRDGHVADRRLAARLRVQREDAAGQLRAAGELLPGDLAGGGPGDGVGDQQQVVQLLSGQPPGREALSEPRGRGRPVTYRCQQLIGASCTGSGIRVRRPADRIGQAGERRDEGKGGELAGRLLAHASSRLSGDGLSVDCEGRPGGEASPVSGFLESGRGTEPLGFEMNDRDRHVGPLRQSNESSLPDSCPFVAAPNSEKDQVQFPGLQHTAGEAEFRLPYGGRGDGLGPACGLESGEEVIRGKGRPVRGTIRLVP
jgi:hypothetical protein